MQKFPRADLYCVTELLKGEEQERRTRMRGKNRSEEARNITVVVMIHQSAERVQVVENL